MIFQKTQKKWQSKIKKYIFPKCIDLLRSHHSLKFYLLVTKHDKGLINEKASTQGIVGKKNFPFPFLVLFGWLTNQSNMRKTDKRKSNVFSCAWRPPRTWEVQRYKGGLMYTRHPELGMRQGALWASKGYCRIIRTEIQ